MQSLLNSIWTEHELNLFKKNCNSLIFDINAVHIPYESYTKFKFLQ